MLVCCVCQSLQLAVSHTSKESLPRNIEFLITETYNWFSTLPNRRQAYRQIYGVINCGKNPLTITKVCATGWLTIEPAVSRIPSQWCELKLHFELARRNENCYTADMLHGTFKDEKNRPYITYLKSILIDIRHSWH